MNTLRIGDKMRQWRNGAGNAPRHYAGTRSATGRALSRTRSLTAAAIAVAMMATVTVTSLLPTYSAKADTAEAGICTPKPISLGDNVGDPTVDSGVATYVGGNMYVGANNMNNGGAYTDLSSTQKIDKSYAVEAEGLTLVNGKLATNGVKNSWGNKGFRFGVVGFGAQFRPKSGSDVLVVAGDSTSNTSNPTGSMWDADNKSVSALGGFDNGSTGRAFVQNTNSDLTWYSARIKGDTSWHLNVDNNSSGSNAGRSVWDATASTDAATGTNVHYDNTTGLSNVTLNGATKNYSTFYTDNVLGLSTHLAGLQNSDSVHVAEGTVGTAESSTQTSTTGATYSNGYYMRHHYNFGGSNQIQYGFKFDASGSNAEKLITFTGDGTSAMQVFNIDATQLSSDGYRGVDFNFTNIPGNASVVVNVSGGNVDFHTGWRFWWNGLEIGDGYSKVATDAQKTAYSTAAQKIMWNFKDATQVTIRGGVATEGAKDNKQTTDDPAAAMLGSILVPHGNFEDHVTTNGRVYVGGDFSMYNPTAIPYINNNDGWEGRTASVINMDQERHNLPWNGTFNSSCAVIQINKVDSSKKALAGTTWGVFKNYADATKAGTAANALRVVKDGGAFDLNDTDNGTIQIGSLNPNATYYLKEIASASGYQVSDKVYQITAGAGGSIAQDVKESSNGTTWTAVADNRIVNEKKGASLEWSKVDGSDSNKVLSGSEWQLTTSDGQTAYQITDSTKDVTSVKIYYNGNVQSETITMTKGIPFDLTASVFGNGNKTDGVPQGVAWTATGSVVVDDNGKVTAVNDGDGTVTVCSLAATNICATVNVTVPTGTIIKPTPKNTTTFYFKAEGYTSGNTKLRYRLLAEGNEDWSTEDTDPVLSNATNCSGWLSVTIDNPGLKAVEFLFYQGDSWYHSGSASSSSNFTLSAGQSAVAVQDYRAVNGAPSGCSAGGGSGSGGSTTTGTVIITGDSVVSLGKTITLTATPTPSSDTVTWYSGNTSVASVASVTAGSDNTATVKGLRAGTTTITAKTPSGATASVIVTVKDDSTVGVYFKKSAVNSKWSNYYLHYQKTADYWPAVKMEDACNGDYVVAYIPKADAHKGYGFLFRDSTDIKTGNWYGSNGWNTNGDNFTFWNNGKGMHIESNSDKGEGEPSACQTTRSVARVKARVPANRQRSSKTAVAGSGSSTTTVYSCGDALGKCDMNTAPGYFKVTDLADGTYTLTEMVAPNGYTAGGPYTVTITTVNGVTKVSITNAGDTAITGNKIPNTRNTGTISWNKVSSDSNNGKKLSGSEWKLTKTKNFGWNDKDKAEYTDIASADQKLITITDCVPAENKTAAETTCSAPAGAAEGQPYDVDPAAGQFKLEGLDWGTYTLVETKAPDGYDVDSTVRTFTFGPVEGSDVTGNWNSNSVAEGTADKTGAFTTADKTYDSDVFNFAVGGIKNQPGVVLPATGGTGNSWIYAAALVAALIGVVAAGMALKVRRRQ